MIKYFRTYQEARKYISNAGLVTKPYRIKIWLFGSLDEAWAVKVL